MNDSIECLYYPFSRLLDARTLKYLLLIFDSITFLDEAESLEWRKALLKQMEDLGEATFSTYRQIADEYDMLHEAGAVQILNPRQLGTRGSLPVALATVSDLSDPHFVRQAQQPSKYNLPSLPLSFFKKGSSDKPTWQTFSGKLATPLLTDDFFLSDEMWRSHILIPGTEQSSWTLSYEGGSAAVVNFYLESAQELGLTPVTTSSLHHRLVQTKLKRIFHERQASIDFIDSAERKRFRTILGYSEVIHLLGQIFPQSLLENISFREILKFRFETQELRQGFVDEINQALRVIDSDPSSAKYDKEVIHAMQKLAADLKHHEAEMVATRDKMFPAIAKALMYGAAGGSALSALVTFLGGLSPGGVVAASAVTISSAFLAEAMGIWFQRRNLQRALPSSVSYFVEMSQFVKKQNPSVS